MRTEKNLKKAKTPVKLEPIGNYDHNSYDLEVPKKLPKNPDPIILEMLSDNPKKHPIDNNIFMEVI